MSLYDLRNEIPVWNGTESVSYLSPKIWDLAPSEAKESASLNAIKFEIKSWGGSIRMSMQNMENISWASEICNNMKKLLFLWNIISLWSLHTSALSFPLSIYQICVATGYCVLSFIGCKLTLISFTENNCNC